MTGADEWEGAGAVDDDPGPAPETQRAAAPVTVAAAGAGDASDEAAESSGVPARRHVRRWFVAAVAAAVALLAVGGAAVVTRQPSGPDTRESFPDAKVPFPSETASDVVSYSDHVVLVTAISEIDLPKHEYPTATPSPLPSEEPTILRKVTFRIDATLWSRPDARPVPGEFTMVWYGWLQRGGKRVPYVGPGTPWVFVGGQYLMPVAYEGDALKSFQYRAVFRFERGVVDPEFQDSALTRELAGASRDQIVKVFASAAPDPLAVRFGHLPPRERLNAVVATSKR